MEEMPLVLSNELVGKSFETNIKKMWKLLGDDQVLTIGVHGMGGVGKTLLVTHIKNEITRKGIFKYVYWVTVSPDFSIFKLQSDVAKLISVNLDDDDERIRAENLSSTLETKQKAVLILDDVWKNIDLQKVGIPLRVNGIKLILTSRLESVCQQMGCTPSNIIQMEPLSGEEAWELFLLKLGYHGIPATLPPKVSEIARSIVDECYGLPLGINVMARTMKGVSDIHQWRHALSKLQNLAQGEEIFKVLRLSYDSLTVKNVKTCFLHCALYHGIVRKELVMKLVDEGLINGMRSLEEIFDEGLVLLDKLIGHSLLLEDDFLHMHGLVRDMACHILKEGHRYMVKCNKGLRAIPHLQEWTIDLEKVSLVHNNIQEIPAGTSPCCPKLSTLILVSNPLRCIPNCFFMHMNFLAVLDLSCNPCLTSLPNSISNLRSLVSLILQGCKSLEDVPPLGQLQALSRLDISETSIHEVPQGLQMLINLKWLDLSRNYNLKLIPGSVTPGLTKMQYLNICYNYGSAKVNVKDIQGMSKLECFAGSFQDCQNFNNYVRIILDRGYGPKTYYLHSGIGPEYSQDCLYDYNFPGDDDCQIVSIGDCKETVHLLPRDIAKLHVTGNMQWRCLCYALSFCGPSSLRYSDVRFCSKLESLFCLSSSCSLCTNLHSLESLNLNNLKSLAVIWKENNENMTQFLSPGNVFSHLRNLEISYCHEMEKLFTPGLLPQLQNLVTIEVSYCDSMKEIFAQGRWGHKGHVTTIILPKLKRLELRCLQQLKSVCQGSLVCASSSVLKINGCPSLERHPTLQVL